MYEYPLDDGMTRAEYHAFFGQGLKRHCILGNDYDVTNEHLVSADGGTRPSGEVFGYHAITRQYVRRYMLPVMHTETNLLQGPAGDEAVTWLRKQWANVPRVGRDGVPLLGFTWYSLTDQVDWDTALREPNGRVHPVGLYDLDRRVRPVGTAYRDLIREWREFLPTQSVALSLPAFPPSRQDDALVRDIAEHARRWAGRGPTGDDGATPPGEPSVVPPDLPAGLPAADDPGARAPAVMSDALP